MPKHPELLNLSTLTSEHCDFTVITFNCRVSFSFCRCFTTNMKRQRVLSKLGAECAKAISSQSYKVYRTKLDHQTEVSLLVPPKNERFLADGRLRTKWSKIHARTQTIDLIDSYITASFCKHSKARCASWPDCLGKTHCGVIKAERRFLWCWKVAMITTDTAFSQRSPQLIISHPTLFLHLQLFTTEVGSLWEMSLSAYILPKPVSIISVSPVVTVSQFLVIQSLNCHNSIPSPWKYFSKPAAGKRPSKVYSAKHTKYVSWGWNTLPLAYLMSFTSLKECR